ncbi:MAG TPA: head GIN domain-containing protein [Chitinophagaceae bacterium]|jgi:putative autotransporter adhesin-like protein|nr:head GIN domain-containing protein [Chitinophagaceae bacterium]
MKNFVVVVLLAAGILIFPSCEKVVGEGPLVTQTRNVGNFSGVSSEMSGKVNFAIAPEYKVEITAQQNILDVLNTNVVNGVLHIDFKDNVRVKQHEDLLINITAPYADYFRLSGSGNMNVQGNITANNLKVTLSGSGDIAVQNAVIADKIDADISGSGNINVANGSAVNEDVDISGSGKVEMPGVSAESAVTHTSGSGDVKLAVSKNLDAHITGSGSVYYHGNPIISTHISGSGRVIPF